MNPSPGHSGGSVKSNDQSSTFTPNFKVILTGEVGVGKTAIFNRVRQQGHGVSDVTSSSAVSPAMAASTIGVDTCSHTFPTRHGNISLTLWDTAGVERYRTLTRNYYRNTHACLLVFSMNDPASLFYLPRWQKDVLECAPSAAVYLIGNKSDLQHEVLDSAMESFASTHDCQAAFRTSALTGEGLQSALTAVCEDLVGRHHRHWDLKEQDQLWQEGSGLHVHGSGEHDVTKKCC